MTEPYPQFGHEADPQSDPFRRLEAILKTSSARLEALFALPDRPLTIEVLREINPEYAQAAETVAQTALQWPNEESAVGLPDDSFVRTLYDDDPEQAFIRPIHLQNDEVGSHYNNFFILLKTVHSMPSEDSMKQYLETGDIAAFAYGTKPYVARAYALEPEFMKALQEATATVSNMAKWDETMYEGWLDPDFSPDKATLLRATRIAYVMLARLMRRDDTQIQAALLRLPQPEAKPAINDPAIELRA